MSVRRDFIEVTVRFIKDGEGRKLLGCDLVKADGKVYKTLNVDKPFKEVFHGMFPIEKSISLREFADKTDGSTCLFLSESGQTHGHLLHDGEVVLWSQSAREYINHGVINAECKAKNLLEEKLIELGISPRCISVERAGDVNHFFDDFYDNVYTDAAKAPWVLDDKFETEEATYCIVFGKDAKGANESLKEIVVALSVMNDPKRLKHIARLVSDVMRGKHRRNFQTPYAARP